MRVDYLKERKTNHTAADPLRLETARLDLFAATLDLAQMDRRDPVELAWALHGYLPADWPPEFIDDQSRQYALDKLQRDPDSAGWWAWYIVEKESRRLAGVVGYKGRPDAAGLIELGYTLVPSAQNRGYATEAAEALVVWGLRQPGVQTIIAETFPYLTRSVRVLTKLGFAFAGPGSEPESLRYIRWK